MRLEEALFMLRQGTKLTREGWNAPHRIRLQRPDANSMNNRPYVVFEAANGDVIPWTCSQADLLAEDWTATE